MNVDLNKQILMDPYRRLGKADHSELLPLILRRKTCKTRVNHAVEADGGIFTMGTRKYVHSL